MWKKSSRLQRLNSTIYVMGCDCGENFRQCSVGTSLFDTCTKCFWRFEFWRWDQLFGPDACRWCRQTRRVPKKWLQHGPTLVSNRRRRRKGFGHLLDWKLAKAIILITFILLWKRSPKFPFLKDFLWCSGPRAWCHTAEDWKPHSLKLKGGVAWV